MDSRITEQSEEDDIAQIHAALRKYNLANREPSENIPLGIFQEDCQGNKLAGITGFRAYYIKEL